VLAAVALVASLALDMETDEGSGPPVSGDHRHARYAFVVCDEVQPNAPFWEAGEAGVHTHGDGIIHIHPFTAAEAGREERLVKWFEYGGGVLTDDRVRLPGSDDEYADGDECADGAEGVLQVFVTPAATGVEEELEDWGDYIPQDGDLVVIYFGRDLSPED
jgi:hypothetical protein